MNISEIIANKGPESAFAAIVAALKNNTIEGYEWSAGKLWVLGATGPSHSIGARTATFAAIHIATEDDDASQDAGLREFALRKMDETNAANR